MASTSVEAGVMMAWTLVTHTVGVLRGDIQRLDDKYSTPTGWPTDPLAELVCLGCFALCMFVVCRVMQATVFVAIARTIGMKTPVQVKKFTESCRELSFYLLSLSLSWAIFSPEPWMYNLDDMWKYDRQFTVPLDFKALYVFECSWYLAGLVALWFVDTRKKDFVEMSLHHVVTILLLVLSYTASHMRVGAVVFVLHNLADPFLQSAKLCKYAKLEMLSTLGFVGFMLMFLASRLVYYPVVIHSCHFRGPGYFFNRSHDLQENTLTGLLTVLYPIHLFWFYLIVKVAIRTVSGSKVSDARSDSDEEDKPDVKKKKK